MAVFDEFCPIYPSSDEADTSWRPTSTVLLAPDGWSHVFPVDNPRPFYSTSLLRVFAALGRH